MKSLTACAWHAASVAAACALEGQLLETGHRLLLHVSGRALLEVNS